MNKIVVLLLVLLCMVGAASASDWRLISGEQYGDFDGYNWTGSTWQVDDAIASGLTGNDSHPSVFEKDSTWYAIVGTSDVVYYGYNWTGSAWQQDPMINGSLGDGTSPTVFEKDSTWYLIAGVYQGIFYGYNWTGSAWQVDDAIVSGLGDIGYSSTPTVFEKDSTWYLISGEYYGAFYGYNWTGSAWQQDPMINGSLGNVGYYSTPTVFEKDSTWYLISGENSGDYYGYNWTGSAWQVDDAIVSGLGDVGDRSAPMVFNFAATAGAPNITSYAPTDTIYPEVADSQLFNVTTDQITNCTWYINGTQVQYNTSATEHAYTNTSLVGGYWNFTAVVNNTNGADSQTWLFEVGADSITYIVLQYTPTNQSMITEWNVTRIGSNVTDWGIWQNYTFSGWTYYFRYTNGTEIMNQTATSNNESLWFNGSSLLPVGVYYIDATSGATNTITLCANEYALINNWTTDQTFQQIAANISNDVCYSYYNSTSGLWEAYRAGYTYNHDAIIPKNCSVFVFIDGETTISATPNTGGVTIPQDAWFYSYLPGSTVKTLTEIETAMNADGLDVWSLYAFDNATQAYTSTGSYSVSPNEGYAVYCNVTGEWTP